MSVKSLLAFAGTAAALSQAYKLTSFLYNFVRPSSLPRYLETSDGSEPWAFITGASDGVGKAFAADLASRGFNIVLHGRNPTKLDAVKSDLLERYPTRKFRIVIADASRLASIDFTAIAKSVSDITIKILINNAGSTMGSGHEFDTIEEYSTSELEANVAINATFPLLMTRALMPNLIAHQPALIINIGSIAALGMPLFPAYAPSKAFLMTMNYELGLEQFYTGRDIEVLGLGIGSVTNTGTICLPESVMVPDGPTWVRSALARVGCGKSQLMPYLPHAIQAYMLTCVPDVLAPRFKAFAIMDMMKQRPTGVDSWQNVRAGKEKKKEM